MAFSFYSNPMALFTSLESNHDHTFVLASALFATVAALCSWKTAWMYKTWTALQREIQRRYNAWIFLFNGPDMIQAAFEKSNGRPFEMFAPDNRYVFVSSPSQIKEVDTTSDTILSLQAASKQMLQPMYSMHGFNWFNIRGTEGVGFIRALRTLLTNHLPSIIPDLRVVTSHRMKLEIQKFKLSDGTNQVPIYPMVVTLIVLANSFSFFGPELAKNEAFMSSALSYVEETLLIAEIVRLVPRFLAPVVGSILGRQVKCHARVYQALMVVAEERVRERDLGINTTKHNDCIQWIMDTSPKRNPWSAQRVVFELMAIWFGSVHAMSTTVTFAIQDLCLHPEYMSRLREEAESAEFASFEKTARGLPFLDSFIKESARLTPVESLSTRRQALKPFVLSDGTKLATGDWACTPVKALMQSEEHYPHSLDFNGFRFVDAQLLNEEDRSINHAFQPDASKLTDVGNTYHVWGTGRMACPGRFYAAAIMKILVSQVILNYDIELVHSQGKRWWTWRSSMLPTDRTVVRFSARLEE